MFNTPSRAEGQLCWLWILLLVGSCQASPSPSGPKLTRNIRPYTEPLVQVQEPGNGTLQGIFPPTSYEESEESPENDTKDLTMQEIQNQKQFALYLMLLNQLSALSDQNASRSDENGTNVTSGTISGQEPSDISAVPRTPPPPPTTTTAPKPPPEALVYSQRGHNRHRKQSGFPLFAPQAFPGQNLFPAFGQVPNLFRNIVPPGVPSLFPGQQNAAPGNGPVMPPQRQTMNAPQLPFLDVLNNFALNMQRAPNLLYDSMFRRTMMRPMDDTRTYQDSRSSQLDPITNRKRGQAPSPGAMAVLQDALKTMQTMQTRTNKLVMNFFNSNNDGLPVNNEVEVVSRESPRHEGPVSTDAFDFASTASASTSNRAGRARPSSFLILIPILFWTLFHF